MAWILIVQELGGEVKIHAINIVDIVSTVDYNFAYLLWQLKFFGVSIETETHF